MSELEYLAVTEKTLGTGDQAVIDHFTYGAKDSFIDASTRVLKSMPADECGAFEKYGQDCISHLRTAFSNIGIAYAKSDQEKRRKPIFVEQVRYKLFQPTDHYHPLATRDGMYLNSALYLAASDIFNNLSDIGYITRRNIPNSQMLNPEGFSIALDMLNDELLSNYDGLLGKVKLLRNFYTSAIKGDPDRSISQYDILHEASVSLEIIEMIAMNHVSLRMTPEEAKFIMKSHFRDSLPKLDVETKEIGALIKQSIDAIFVNPEP